MNQRLFSLMQSIRVKSLSTVLTVLVVSTGARAADCTFAARPDDFLVRESRVRREVSATALKLGKALPRSAAATPQAAGSIPHKNFIDDFIFGAMAAKNVPSARLTTDEEFFRRINFDLTGR